MDEYEKLLREGTERRKQDAFRRKLLDQLKRDSERNIFRGIIYLMMSAISYGFILHDLSSEEMMKRSDAFMLLILGMPFAIFLQSGLSDIYKNPKDIFLRDLLEEKIKNEE